MCARSKMHAFNSMDPRSGSEQFIYNWKLGNKNLDLDQGNWRQHNGMDKRTPEQRYI
jgi:hypothetical protein